MNLPYENVRKQIQTADFAFFRGKRCFSRAIQLWTRSVYSHVGLFVWLKFGSDCRRLCVIEALEGRGVQVLPASQVVRRDGQVDWFRLILKLQESGEGADRERRPAWLCRETIAGYALQRWGSRYASPWQFVRSFGWLCRRVAGRPRDLDPDRFFCSELAASALQASGYSDPEIEIPAGTPPETISRLSCLLRQGTVIA